MNSDPSPTTIISSTQRGGQLIEVNWDVEANYQHQDWPGSPATGLRRWGGWLGTERLRTSYNGGVEASFTSLPWGDGQSAAGGDADANHYALLDHDTESDTDHAQFRQYSNLQGRFLSPDPYDGSYDLSNPQSLNRYVYAQNSPLGFVDPSGENEIGVGTGGLMMGCYSDGLAVPCSYLFGGGAPGGIDGGGFGGGFGGSMVPVTTETTFSTTITINNSIYLPGFSDLVSILGDPGDYFGPPQTIQIDSNLLNLPDTQITLNNTFSSSSYYYFPVNVNPNGSSISTSGGGGGVAANNDSIFKHWPLNGNLWPGYKEQDGVCTTGPLEKTMNGRPDILNCCAAHDACYTQYNCNASSFLPGVPGPCKLICNANVAACIATANKSKGD
jgi:RHS repeat-associated protein